MKKFKRYFAVLLAMIMIFSLNCMSVFAAEQEEVNEGCVEISLDQAQLYASNY